MASRETAQDLGTQHACNVFIDFEDDPVARSGAAAPPPKRAVPRRHADRTRANTRAQVDSPAALPERLSRAMRARLAAQALTGVASDRSVAADPPGAFDPAAFTRHEYVSPLVRARETWALTRYERRLEERIQAARLRRCVTIAVVSPKGGVGKSTIATLLGSLLAFLRRDRVVAVDTNPDWGSLGRRLVPEHHVFIDDLLTGALRDGRPAATELDQALGRGPDGLMVAPAPTDPDRAARLDEAAYRTLLTGLRDFVGTLVLDCGTGLGAPAARAALACADQLVLVSDAEPDTASLVAEAARGLSAAKPSLVLLANRLDRGSRLDVAALQAQVPSARGLVTLPTDRRGAARLQASRFTWARAPRRWRAPVRELVALLVAEWPELEIAE
jgi:MinD-like ATPase involved in chromosome partitioning or flagellar assembly